jgi:hypothetical protein
MLAGPCGGGRDFVEPPPAVEERLLPQGAQGVRLWADKLVRHYYDTIFVIKKKRMEQNRAREQGGSKLRVFTRPYRNGSHCCGGESSQSEIWYARGLLASGLFAIGLFTTGLYASRLFTTGLYASRPTFWGCTHLDKIWYVREVFSARAGAVPWEAGLLRGSVVLPSQIRSSGLPGAQEPPW